MSLFDVDEQIAFEEGSPRSITTIPLWVKVPKHEWKVLPPGLYACSPGEFKTVLVDAFPTSQKRKSIYAGFLRLRSYLTGYTLSGWHWVSGTFVTDKHSPADMDVTSFFDAIVFDRLPGETQQFLKEKFGNAEAGIRDFQCDTAFILAYSKSDPLYLVYRQRAEDKQAAYGRTNPEKTGVDAPRGFLRLPMDAESSHPDKHEESDNPSGNLSTMTTRDTSDDSIEVLRFEIESIDRTIQSLKDSGDTRSSTQFWLASLGAEKERFARRLRTAELMTSDQDGEIVWDGGTTKNNRLDLNILINSLIRFKRGISFIDSNFSFQVGIPLKGSYRIPFYYTETETAESAQMKLVEVEPVKPVDIFVSILDDDASETNIINHLDSKNAQQNYALLMKEVAENGLTVEIRTKTTPYGGKLTPGFASKRKDWFGHTDVSVSNVVINGILESGTTVAGYIKLKVSDKKRISLRVDNARARLMVGIQLGANVRATVEKVVTEHPDLHTPVITHRLISIERNDIPMKFD